jgi:DNA polymerase I-like protein with 3'-5' exonuclease and polymerase domains
VLYSDPPVLPASDRFLSTALGTHGWGDVPCLAGDRAMDAARSSWADRPMAVDIESFGLGRLSARLKCVSFSTGDAAIVLDPRDRRQYEAARFVIATAPELIFHNSTFDVPNLGRNGLITRADVGKVTDTLIYARMAEPDALTSKNLAATGHRYLGTPKEDQLAAAFKMLGLTKEQGYYQFDIDRYVYLHGAADDAIMTARLREVVRQAAYARLTTGHPFTENGVVGDEAWDLVENPQRLNRIFLRRALVGLRTDLEFLDAYREANAVDLQRTEDTLVRHDIRPGNNNDLIAFLDKADAIPADYPRTAKTKKPSTVAKHLETLAHPLAKTYVQHKQLLKVDKDYLAKVVDLADDNGRVYPGTNILAAITGRMSMDNPPLHQFPEGARGIILFDEGDRGTSLDWAQIEPVTIANIAGDHAIVAAYESGEMDFYQGVALAAGLARPDAKVTLLAQLYGEGLAKLAFDLGIPVTREDAAFLAQSGIESGTSAEELRELIFEALPLTADLVRPASAGPEGRLRSIARHYRVVFTLAGRILPIPMGKGWLQEDGTYGPPSPAVHKGVNFMVQGSAYDILADTILRVEDAGLGDALYLAMHDELVVSTDAAHDIEMIMQRPPERLCRLAKRVPILRTDRADLGERWAKV